MELSIFISKIILICNLLWSLKLVIKAIRKKNITGYVFLLPVFIVFYILPDIVDDILGLSFDPSYSYILQATSMPKIQLFYNLYCIILLIAFNLHFKYLSKSKIGRLKFDNKNTGEFLVRIYNKFKLPLWILISIPILYVFVLHFGADYYSVYLRRGHIFSIAPSYHGLMAKIALFGVIIIALINTVILLKQRIYGLNRKFLLIPLGFLLFSLFWIHGKRSIVANFLMVQFMLLLITNLLSLKRFMITILIVGVGFISFLGFYGKNVSDNSKEIYYDLRTDFSRDYGVKFVMYNDLIRERHILPEPLASFKFNLLFFIPRELWPNKPMPYAVYFTNAAFGNFGGEDSYMGWGLTTSIFAESISNLGLVGLFFAPFILMFFLQKEAKRKNPIFKLLSILISVLLLIIHPVAFMVIIIPFILILIKKKKRKLV